MRWDEMSPADHNSKLDTCSFEERCITSDDSIRVQNYRGNNWESFSVFMMRILPFRSVFMRNFTLNFVERC